MGCISSKAAADAAHQKEEEEAALGPPSEIMDASDHAQDLVMIVSKTIGLHLDVIFFRRLEGDANDYAYSEQTQ